LQQDLRDLRLLRLMRAKKPAAPGSPAAGSTPRLPSSSSMPSSSSALPYSEARARCWCSRSSCMDTHRPPRPPCHRRNPSRLYILFDRRPLRLWRHASNVVESHERSPILPFQVRAAATDASSVFAAAAAAAAVNAANATAAAATLAADDAAAAAATAVTAAADAASIAADAAAAAATAAAAGKSTNSQFIHIQRAQDPPLPDVFVTPYIFLA